jgi:hypothetical protein
MKKQVLKQIKSLQLGDLVRIEWFDASIGKSSAGAIDVPVRSWGIYIGILGDLNKHIILAQNNFRYMDGLYDIDYTAIPLAWTVKATVLNKNEVSLEEAKLLLRCFLSGRRRSLYRRIRQKRVTNHEQLD